MNANRVTLFILALVVASHISQQARGALTPALSSDYRKYAPDREVDITHLALDLTPNFSRRRITGEAKLTFKPMAKPCRELRLDAVDLRIKGVKATSPVRGWQATARNLIVTFEQSLPPDREVSVTISYEAEPVRGLYFRTPETGYRPGDTHLFTQGESTDGRYWYPCFDSPNEKFTSEVTCRVPEGMTVLSNGRLVSETKDSQTGLVAARWLQDKPHVNYLIALVAGHLKKLEAAHGAIPLTFYTVPSEFGNVANSFKDTGDMMTFFESEIGIPYPWAKYAQVCVSDFVASGMENTSLCILTEDTLFDASSEGIRSSQGLVAHELAHQWFGNLVTCKDWSHAWLNEGFATYYDRLYDRRRNGRDSFLYSLYNDARLLRDLPNDTTPIVTRTYDSPEEQFSSLAYIKGSWVLHMLRSQLGEELFRRCVRTYLQRRQYDTVVTEDLNAVIEELSGRSYDQFFDQWVYHAHHPELEVSYSWDELAKMAKVSIRQVQAISDKVLLFRFPLTIRFKSENEATDREVIVKEQSEDFYFALRAAPETVRIDPDLALLARIRFSPPVQMLHNQLEEMDDVVGRLIAVAQLGGRGDLESVAKLKEALGQDPFYGVRIEASKVLGSIHSKEAREALLGALDQPDARVRQQVWQDLRKFYSADVLEAVRQAQPRERNPDILAEMIGALGAYSHPDTRATLVRHLNTPSFRNILADAAIQAMSAQDDPAFVAPLLEALGSQESKFTSSSFGNGLVALGRIARHEDKKDAVREFLLRHVNHPKQHVASTAITALGELGDPKAIAVLETFAHAPKERPEREAAERAIASIRNRGKPGAELGEMRGKMLGIEKDNRELRKELEELRKKLTELAPELGIEKAKEEKKRKKK